MRRVTRREVTKLQSYAERKGADLLARARVNENCGTGDLTYLDAGKNTSEGVRNPTLRSPDVSFTVSNLPLWPPSPTNASRYWLLRFLSMRSKYGFRSTGAPRPSE